MNLTILIDLDGTLLTNHIDHFIPVYLEALSRHLHPVPPQLIIQEIMFATRKMLENQSPADTLENIFDRHFYPAIGRNKLELQEKIDSFYRDVYPKLRQYTSQKPGVIEFIKNSFERGAQVTIATNPIFPRTAIHQRLYWAGLPPEEYPFSIISTYETFHFAKPSPVFYAELLARLGWPVGPVVMIVNDFDMDIQPAELLNVPTYLLDDLGPELGKKLGSGSGSGNISSLSHWINQASLKNLGYVYQNKESFLSIIKSTPAVIHTIIKELPNHPFTSTSQIEGWSLNEILGHLGNEEKNVHLPSIQKFLSIKNLMFQETKTDQGISASQNFPSDEISIFHEYLEARGELIQTLEKIPDYEWKRSTESGDCGNPTIIGLCGIIASHDQEHIRQIKQLII